MIDDLMFKQDKHLLEQQIQQQKVIQEQVNSINRPALFIYSILPI